MKTIDYKDDPRAVLIHFNPNHDPRNGQFAENPSGINYKRGPFGGKEIVNNKNEKVVFNRRKNSAVALKLAKIFPGVKDTIERAFSYDINDRSGKRIGYLELEDMGNKTLYGSWISIDDEYRGNGYAQSAMRTILSEAKQNGYKKMTLEVPGSSPDARHIYEKYGFRASEKQPSDIDPDDIWGGLTYMELKL